jgi:lysophospholipase L1-like esterase
MLGRIVRTLGGLVVATAIFLVTGEGLTRAFSLVDRLNGYTRLLFAPGPSAELPFRLRAGVTTTFFGVPVRVNAQGLRGPEVATEPAPGTLRVLCVGDSVMFGQGVAEEETLPAMLALRLAARGRPVEALNAGVQGYDTVAEAAYVAGPGLALRPGAIVVGMSLNDYDPAPVYDATGVLARRPAAGATPTLLERSEFLLLLRWLRAWSRGQLLTQLMARAEPHASPAPDAGASVDRLVAEEHLRFYAAPDPALWARMRGALERLRDAAATHVVPLRIAIFPESYQLAGDAPDLGPQRRLAALCAELRLRCLDLEPVFRAAGGALFQDAQHPNARGLAIAADAIAAALPP